MMTDITQELMTPQEAAKWFRRSPSWLRQQHELVRVGGPGGQPLYHVRVCRAYVLGRMCDMPAAELRTVQLEALAAACGLPPAVVAAAAMQPAAKGAAAPPAIGCEESVVFVE